MQFKKKLDYQNVHVLRLHILKKIWTAPLVVEAL
jgi:hypothetical protein